MIETCIQELYEKLKDISDTPLLEAQWYFEEENPPSIEEFINRRKKKEPYGKIMGHVGFWKYDFKISKDVLSPRPDSEMLIEAVLQTYPDKKSSYTLLDIGTGSGCLLSTLLHEYPLWQGTGIDICQKALSVAKEMPLIVNLGVLLDIFVAVFILGLLIGEIGNIYENPDVCQLCNLKDCECVDD